MLLPSTYNFAIAIFEIFNSFKKVKEATQPYESMYVFLSNMLPVL